jgi:GntR family transcriptional regulator of vanillate catabolism
MTTRTERTIAALRQSILDGRFGPGMHLGEEVLSQDFGVSRTPIRNALRVLANEQLLAYEPNCGYVVRRYTTTDVLHAYDVRGALEAMACRLAAEAGLSTGRRAKLAAINQAAGLIIARGAWGPEDQAAWRDCNSDFHATIMDASGNRLLDVAAQQMRQIPRLYDHRMEPGSAFYESVYTPANRERSHAEHVQLFSAISGRQGARAEHLMREHVWRNRELLHQRADELAAAAAEQAPAEPQKRRR